MCQGRSEEINPPKADLINEPDSGIARTYISSDALN